VDSPLGATCLRGLADPLARQPVEQELIAMRNRTEFVLPVNDGRKPNRKQRPELLRFIELQIKAAESFIWELSLYRMWLTHGLVPAERIALLLNAEDGGAQ
jgi:hypothetical protein